MAVDFKGQTIPCSNIPMAHLVDNGQENLQQSYIPTGNVALKSVLNDFPLTIKGKNGDSNVSSRLSVTRKFLLEC